MAELFPEAIFAKAKKEGVNVYATLDFRKFLAENPIDRYLYLPKVEIASDPSGMKRVYKPSKKTGNKPQRVTSVPTEDMLFRPPWNMCFNATRPATAAVGGGGRGGSSRLQSRMTFDERHRLRMEKTNYYPWYTRYGNGMRSGCDRGASAPARRIRYNLSDTNFW